MTREEAKQTILIKSKSYESAHQNYIHILTLHKIIDDIFDEHEVQLKAKYEEIERLKKLVNDFNNTYSVGDFDFESYYAMLKDN